jgi:GGDEF domain-containing protein
MRTGSVNKRSLDEPLLDRAANMMLQKMHQKLVYNASHDPVTHLANRRVLRLLKDG